MYLSYQNYQKIIMNFKLKILYLTLILTIHFLYTYGQPSQLKYAINPDTLKKIDTELKNDIYGKITGIVIMVKSRIIFENYYGFNSNITLHPISSVTKSVTSLITGICLDKGIISSIDVPIYTYFPEYKSIFDKDTLKKRITIRHLLNQTSGLRWDEWTKHYSYAGNALIELSQSDSNWVKTTLSLPIDYKPGTHFTYNSGNSQVIKEILCKASGKDFDWLANSYLFKPLGIDNIHWDYYSGNGYPAWGGISTTTREMARIGTLVCFKGNWNNNQIVSEEWIRVSTNVESKNGKADYGLHWWISKQPDNMPLIYAAGYGDQYIYIAPDKQIVIAINGQNFTDYKWPKTIDKLINTILSSITIE